MKIRSLTFEKLGKNSMEIVLEKGIVIGYIDWYPEIPQGKKNSTIVQAKLIGIPFMRVKSIGAAKECVRRHHKHTLGYFIKK